LLCSASTHRPWGRWRCALGSQVLGRFREGVLSVIAGLEGKLVFPHRAVALASGIVDPAQVDMGPGLGPSGLQISAESFAKLVGGRLIIALLAEDLADPEMRERTIAMSFQVFLVLLQRSNDLLAESRSHRDTQHGDGDRQFHRSPPTSTSLLQKADDPRTNARGHSPTHAGGGTKL